MKRYIFLFLISFFNFTFADSLVVSKSGPSTYLQKVEFVLPEGESVVGPIRLLPNAKVESLLIKPDNPDVAISGYILEPQKEKWMESILGKTISLEGEGRVITGTVISVKDGYITLDTKKGMVISTLPTFPGKLSSSFSWQDAVAPKITVKLRSKKPQNVAITVSYPVEGFSYQQSYVASVEKEGVFIQEFYHIKNDTSLNLRDIELSVKEADKIKKLYTKTYIEPYSSKILLTKSVKVENISGKTVNIPTQYGINNVVVDVYRDGIFLGSVKVQNYSFNIP